jgi:dGTPase
MDIDYAKILKADRMHQPAPIGKPLLAEFEHDRRKLMFSPALHRLAHLYPTYPALPDRPRNSKLSLALQAAQIGRSIVTQIATYLEYHQHVARENCAALSNTVESACLIRDVGDPPFGRCGETAIRRWFTDFGPGSIKAACRTHAQRELTASDARVVNALADFTEFESHPQSLRVLAKFHWGNNRQGLNLCKSTLAAHIQYLHIVGGGTDGSDAQALELSSAGFFSTEAGMMKSIWSAFGYAPLSQRFPLNYVVETATAIASAFSGLEQTTGDDPQLRLHAFETVKNIWMSSYIPADPDPADEQIMNLLSAASSDEATNNNDSFTDLCGALVDTICEYTARKFIEQQAAIFSGALPGLLSAESGSGTLLAAMQTYLSQRIASDPQSRQQELRGYATVTRLLHHFGVLLQVSIEQFQAALERANNATDDFNVESRLLSLIPAACRSAYAQLVAQLGHGRDVEFEEWNARAHLVVDHIAGLTDESAMDSLRMLDGG